MADQLLPDVRVRRESNSAWTPKGHADPYRKIAFRKSLLTGQKKGRHLREIDHESPKKGGSLSSFGGGLC